MRGCRTGKGDVTDIAYTAATGTANVRIAGDTTGDQQNYNVDDVRTRKGVRNRFAEERRR